MSPGAIAVNDFLDPQQSPLWCCGEELMAAGNAPCSVGRNRQLVFRTSGGWVAPWLRLPLMFLEMNASCPEIELLRIIVKRRTIWCEGGKAPGIKPNGDLCENCAAKQ